MNWQPVLCTVSELARAASHMHHSHIADDANSNPRLTRWTTDDSDRPISIAWTWTKVRGAIAIADLGAVDSNAILIDEDGTLVDEGTRRLHLHAAIWGLPWQQHVND